MLRKGVLVKRPEGTKIYRQRDCVYVYRVIGSEYKKDKTAGVFYSVYKYGTNEQMEK